MSYSESKQREIDKYTRNLVRRQPAWLRTLFDEEKFFFVMEDDGTMCIAYENGLRADIIHNASKLIIRYLNKYPNPIFKTLILQ